MLVDWMKHIATRTPEEHKRIAEMICGLEASYRAEHRIRLSKTATNRSNAIDEQSMWYGWADLHARKLVQYWNNIVIITGNRRGGVCPG